MTTPLILKDWIDKEKLNYVISVSTDELAPQLGKVVYELLHDEVRHINAKAKPFIETTVITENYRQILTRVFQALRNNGIFTAWLNLDMGSGKTHLLTLLTYLLYSYDALKELLQEYEKLGLNGDIAEHTAVFIADLRTPSETIPTFLPFFAKSLRKVKEFDAAKYIEECVERNEFPVASELVRRLRGNTRLLIIIDELHHAILTYRGTESERKLIINTLNFIIQLMNYLRPRSMGFAVLVASARSDYDRVSMIGPKDDQTRELIITAENLLSQLSRLEPVLETRWLSVDEARQIILTKIGAKGDIFHKSFNKFIARVISAESDIPQAQHLRSLIKAMAIYTKNAVDWGHPIVSPASFSEEVLDTLFSTETSIAVRYKSIYNYIIEHGINPLESVSDEVKELVKLIVNIIFTMSVTGREDQLIETIRAYRLGKSRVELLPAISEREIIELLHDLSYDEVMASKALEILGGGGLPYIHSIRVGNTYLYFVVPIENVIAVFNRLIDDRFRGNLANREGLVDTLLNHLNELSGRIGEDAYIIIAKDYNELEVSTRRLDPNFMYLIIYADPELVKYLESVLRGNKQVDLNQLINTWFKNKGLKDPSTWLKEHGRHNVALAVPILNDDVIRGMARFQAIAEAISRVVNDYLLEYTRSGGNLPDLMRRLIEVELSDIHRAIEDKFIEAVRSFTSTITLALRHVYIYECDYSPEAGTNCFVSLKNVEIGSTVNIPRIAVQEEKYSSLLDLLYRISHDGIINLAAGFINKVKNYANFVTDVNLARNIILSNVIDGLKHVGTETISKDMNEYPYGNRIFYVPPSTVAEAAQSITNDELRKALGGDIEVLRSIDSDGNIQFKAISKDTAGIKTAIQPVSLPSLSSLDIFSKAIEDIKAHDGGIITLTIEFNRDSKRSIIPYLYSLRQFIKDIRVKPYDAHE